MRTKRRAAASPVKLELEVELPRRSLGKKVASPVKRESTPGGTPGNGRRRSGRQAAVEVKQEPGRRTSGRHRPAVNYAVKVEITDDEDEDDAGDDDDNDNDNDNDEVDDAMDEDDVEADLGASSGASSGEEEEGESGPAPPPPPKRVRTTRTAAQATPHTTPRSTRAARTPRAAGAHSPRTTPSSKKRKVAPVKVESDSEYEAPAGSGASPIVVDSGDEDEDEAVIRGEPTPEPGEDGLVDSRKYENSELHVQGFEKPLPVVVDNHWVYLFYRFCAERHEMYYRRQAGTPRDQLTSDPTMSAVHIGNVFRQLDPSSLMMRDKIIADGDQSVDEVCCEYRARR